MGVLWTCAAKSITLGIASWTHLFRSTELTMAGFGFGWKQYVFHLWPKRLGVSKAASMHLHLPEPLKKLVLPKRSPHFFSLR